MSDATEPLRFPDLSADEFWAAVTEIVPACPVTVTIAGNTITLEVGELEVTSDSNRGLVKELRQALAA